MIKEKKIPSIIGVIFLMVCVVIGVFLTQNKTTIGSKASGSCTPINPQVANITDNSADISFSTSLPCPVSLLIGDQTFLDVKSQNGSSSNSTIHYFQTKHLQAQKKYNYSIIASGQTIIQDSFTFTTSSTPTSGLPTSNLAWGKVVNSDGKTPANAIVYLNIPGAAPLSSFVTSNGNWSISLASSFNDSKSNWFIPPSSSIDEDIIVISEDGQITQVANNTESNNPVPDITIGTNSLTVPTVAPILDQSVGLGQVGTVSPATVQKLLDINNPKSNESITTAKPDFFGTGPINKTVVIFLDSSETATGQIDTDSTGVWHWSPATNLTIGPHTILVKSQDSTTKLWSQVSRSFTILASDISAGPQYESSSSAKPSLIPTSTSTPVPTIEPTIRTAHPSVVQKPPVTGNTAPTIIIIVCSLIFFIVSVNLIK